MVDQVNRASAQQAAPSDRTHTHNTRTELAPENEPQSPDPKGYRYTAMWMPRDMKPTEMDSEPPGKQAETAGVQVGRRVSIGGRGAAAKAQLV